ncbi:MAG: hypothetical protein WAL59_11705 [Roseiarcus sp.]
MPSFTSAFSNGVPAGIDCPTMMCRQATMRPSFYWSGRTLTLHLKGVKQRWYRAPDLNLRD